MFQLEVSHSRHIFCSPQVFVRKVVQLSQQEEVRGRDWGEGTVIKDRVPGQDYVSSSLLYNIATRKLMQGPLYCEIMLAVAQLGNGERIKCGNPIETCPRTACQRFCPFLI